MIDDVSRDLIIRTVIGEAQNQGPEGRAAVAHVIRNRINTGRWGKTGAEVVLAPRQFEPWDTRSGALMGIRPEDRNYQEIAQIVDTVFAGKSPDPTRGATHFANVSTVKQRNNGTVGNHGWINPSNQTAKIGAHTFFAPDGRKTGRQHMEWANAQNFWQNPVGGGMPGAGPANPQPMGSPQTTPSESTPSFAPQQRPPQPPSISQIMPPRPQQQGGNTPPLGRLLFGDGGLKGFLGPQGPIKTPFGGDGLLGGVLKGMGGPGASPAPAAPSPAMPVGQGSLPLASPVAGGGATPPPLASIMGGGTPAAAGAMGAAPPPLASMASGVGNAAAGGAQALGAMFKSILAML